MKYNMSELIHTLAAAPLASSGFVFEGVGNDRKIA